MSAGRTPSPSWLCANWLTDSDIDFDCTVAIGMVLMTHWDPGTVLTIETPEGPVEGTVREAFWA